MSFLLATALLMADPAIAAAAPAPEPVYAMDTYVVGILRRGPAWTPEVTEATKKLQEGHLANIRAMAEAGALIVAGPFDNKGGPTRGLFIFRNAPLEEIRAMVVRDPAVAAGRLEVELLPWWAAKGLTVDPPTRPAAGAP